MWNGWSALLLSSTMVFDENGLGDDRTDAARTQKPGKSNDYMDEKHDEIAHFLIITNPGIAWS
jgi:hypothetical protein